MKKILFTMIILVGFNSCSTLRSIFGGNDHTSDPIDNPFAQYQNPNDSNFSLKTTKGNQSYEIKVPSGQGAYEQVSMPYQNNQFASNQNESTIDTTYLQNRPTSADYEILSQIPKASVEDVNKQKEIESSLGLQSAEDRNTGVYEQSYLAQMDKIKQLYKAGRYEAVLIEVENQLKLFPYNAKLHEMRGTALDRTGYADLAMKSWKQALKLNPNNLTLKRFVESKEQVRGIASDTTGAVDGGTGK